VPTTLTGLLLFVVLLLPGFAYLVGKERHGTERRLSPFRETVSIVAASVTSELLVLIVFAAIRALWPSRTPDVGALIRDGGRYLRSSHMHYENVAIWAICLLAAATLVAYLATVPAIRSITKKIAGPYPHDSTVSAWWILFERWPYGRDVEVVCMLDDGSAVRGRFGSFNTSADDSPDRDLILRKPIFYRPSGEAAREVPYNMSAVCCPARRIVALFVAYSEPARQSAIPVQEQPDPETSAASPEQSEAGPKSGEPTPEPVQSSPLQQPSGPSLRGQGPQALRPY
jgi:Family of unknown function (DUF6338)